MNDGPFMRACRRQPVPYTPIWLMRQAGRYMPEYRAIRARVSMLELCRSPALVSEVTVFAATKLGVDAAILFADLLLPAEPLGLTLEYRKGEGPVLTPPVRDAAAVDALREPDVAELGYVFEAIRQTRADLPGHLPLLGFAGAPFTFASYLIEGGSSRTYRHTKTLMYGDPGLWDAFMTRITDLTIAYLNGQIDAGVQAVQIFDSWVGALSPSDYSRFVLPHSRRLLGALRPGTPVIHFGTGNAGLLPSMARAGGQVLGVDWRVDLDSAWDAALPEQAIMGNLDPLLLFAPEPVLKAGVAQILRQAGGRPGHIFNLGHGVLPETPVDQARRLVEMVQELSRR